MTKTSEEAKRLYDALKPLALSEEETRRLYDRYKSLPAPKLVLSTASSEDWLPRESDLWTYREAKWVDDPYNTPDVPVISLASLGEAYFLIRLSNVYFASADRAEGEVDATERYWRYQFVRDYRAIWWCTEWGGYLAQLEDDTWVIVCRIVE